MYRDEEWTRHVKSNSEDQLIVIARVSLGGLAVDRRNAYPFRLDQQSQSFLCASLQPIVPCKVLDIAGQVRRLRPRSTHVLLEGLFAPAVVQHDGERESARGEDHVLKRVGQRLLGFNEDGQKLGLRDEGWVKVDLPSIPHVRQQYVESRRRTYHRRSDARG